MSSGKNRRLKALVGGCAVFLAVGQSAVGGPGEHIQVGSATIVPNVDLGMEYRTNIRQTPTDGEGGVNLLVQPSLEIEAKGPDTQFELSGMYSLRKYFSKKLSNADRLNDFDLGVGLKLMKSNPVGLNVKNRTALRNDPNISSLNLKNAFNTRVHNDLTGGIAIRPGPVLEIEVGGIWNFDRFLVPSTAIIESGRLLNQRNRFGPALNAEWRFFPRTAIVLESSYVLNRWNDNWVLTGDTPGELGQFLAKPDSSQFRLATGMRGRFTERMVLSLTLGYGFATYSVKSVTDDSSAEPPTNAGELDGAAVGFNQNVNGLNGLLVTAQVKYEFGEKKDLVFGYRKDFDDVFFTNFVAFNKLFLAFDGRFGRYLGLNTRVDAGFESYRGEADRNDTFIRASGDVSIFINEWMSTTVGTWYIKRLSQDSTAGYSDLNIHLLASFQY